MSKSSISSEIVEVHKVSGPRMTKMTKNELIPENRDLALRGEIALGETYPKHMATPK